MPSSYLSGPRGSARGFLSLPFTFLLLPSSVPRLWPLVARGFAGVVGLPSLLPAVLPLALCGRIDVRANDDSPLRMWVDDEAICHLRLAILSRTTGQGAPAVGSLR